ncbi:hypothetical protein [Shimia sagamensis]|uniref:Uncharacterized protein n=1 Tax=Shimia sagamensis TaxID=1566352 RepID=A0ABY1P121_9RHOB|nr:hypothetical protein [Shimia sagamensis]SMP23766.1 hypothetical protein SAMN06265373_104425 [Shimia sagamensis]
MHTIEDGYRAVGLLIDINWERLLFPTAIIAGLSLGSYIGTMIMNGGLY